MAVYRQPPQPTQRLPRHPIEVAGATVTGSQATETDIANAGSVAIIYIGFQATETITANAGSVLVVVGGAQAAETGTGQAGTVTVLYGGAQASETDTADAGIPAFRLLGSQATETDIVAGGTAHATIAGSQAAESDTVAGGTAVIAVPGSLASESDSVLSGTPNVVVSGAQASESDSGLAGAAIIPIFGEHASESDTANAGDARRVAKPDATVNVGLWTTQAAGLDLHAVIDEDAPDDADYIRSPLVASGTNSCRVSLADVSDPVSSTGHSVQYRYEKNTAGGQQIDLTVRLLQGTTTIASWSHTDIVGGTWVQVAQELTTVQADSITDYTNLRLEFESTAALEAVNQRRARVSWAQFRIPVSVSVSVTGSQAPETDTANAGSLLLAISGSQPSETDTGTAGAPIVVVAGSLATETDTANAGIAVLAVDYRYSDGFAAVTGLDEGSVAAVRSDFSAVATSVDEGSISVTSSDEGSSVAQIREGVTV